MSPATKDGFNKTKTKATQQEKTIRQGFLAFIAVCVTSAATVILFFVNPSEFPLYPGCPVLKITGWYCPGCGGIRALHALAHGRILEAVDYNAFLPVFLPGLFLALFAHLKGYTRSITIPTLVFLGILGILFAIARNSGIPPLDILAP